MSFAEFVLKAQAFLLSLFMTLIPYKGIGLPVMDTKEDNCLLNMELISDTHIEANYPFRSGFLKQGLKRMSNSKTPVDGVVVCGDLTNYADEESLARVYEILGEYCPGQAVVVAGNHDIGHAGDRDVTDITREEALANVVKYHNEFYGDNCESNYYSIDINGYKFIVLGDEVIDGGHWDAISMSQEQLDFLDEQLAAGTAEGKPVFVCCHWPIDGINGEDIIWDGSGIAEDEYPVKAILEKYNNVFYISGHMHGGIRSSEVGDKYDMPIAEQVNGVTYISLPTYGIINQYGITWSGLGAQMEVYEGKVILRPINYLTGNWYANSEYAFELTESENRPVLLTKKCINTFNDEGPSTVFNSCAATADGGAVCVGVQTPEGDSNPLIVKFDKDCKEKWTDSLSADSLSDYADVAVLKDGSIIAVGTTTADDIVPPEEYKAINTSEGIIARYSGDGNRESLRILGGSGGDIIYAVAATADGGYVVGGKTTSADADFENVPGDDCKAFIAKYDASDNIQWIQDVSCPKNSYAQINDLAVSGTDIYAVIQTNAKEGDFASLTGASNGKVYSVVEKLDGSGNLKWMTDFYESGPVELVSIAPANDGGCVVAGSYSATGGLSGSFRSDYFEGGTDGVIVSIDGNGTTRWFRTVKGVGKDYITGITAVPGGYAFAAKTNSANRDYTFLNQGDFDCYLGIIPTAGGKPVEMKSFGGNGADTAKGICLADGSTIYICGGTNSTNGDFADVDAKSDGTTTVGFIAEYELS